MIIKELIGNIGKEKKRKERVKAAQKLAVVMGAAAAVGMATGLLLAPKSGKETREEFKKKAVNTIEDIKDTVQKKAEAVKDSTTHAAKDVRNFIKDVHGKKEGVEKDIKNGLHELKQDINETAEDIANEIKRPIRWKKSAITILR